MRLLEKSTIDTQKADERKREIDEGVKLSKRVDELRRLEADEKARITSWRDGTLQSIQEEIAIKAKEKEALNAEITELRERVKKLQEPIEQELDQLLNVERGNIKKIKDALAEREAELKQKELAHAKLAHELEVEKGRIEDERHRATETLVRTDELHRQAKEELAKVRNDNQIILSAQELREQNLRSRELSISSRERIVETRTKDIERYETSLAEREIKLRDGWRTLLETKKELDEHANTERGS